MGWFNSRPKRLWINRGFSTFVILLILACSLAYLNAAFAAFTSFKFTLTDYGRYVNTIWNCAHGHPFRLLSEYSYLNTHLSFSLILLTPVFWLRDHPFALWIGNWLLTLLGLIIMWRAARRHRIPGTVTAAFLLFYLANPFTQCVLLAEFHGVNLYLFLLPWLYYSLAFQPRMVWLPLLLTWGVREEAAFLVLPMLLYFSLSRGWKTGFFWTALTAIYGLLACTVLFQWINGFPLRAQRPNVNSTDIIAMFNKSGLGQRVLPLLRLMAPTIPFLCRGWVSILSFPAVALLFTFFSPYPAQYGLKYHYPAAPLILLMLGLLHGLALDWQQPSKHPQRRQWLQALFFLSVTIYLHIFYGILPFGGGNTQVYNHQDSRGISTLCAIKHLPKEGLLLSNRRTGGMCANRKDLIIWEQYQTKRWQPGLIFTTLKEVSKNHADILQPALHNGDFGVTFFDGNHIILERGAPTENNKKILTAVSEASRTIRFAYSKKKAGEERVTQNCTLIRYWRGEKGGKKPLIAYGRTITLEAGEYVAGFRIKSERSRTKANNDPGILQLVERSSQALLSQSAIRPGPTDTHGFFVQRLQLQLRHKTQIEPQVLGGEGQLELDYVTLRPKRGREVQR